MIFNKTKYKFSFNIRKQLYLCHWFWLPECISFQLEKNYWHNYILFSVELPKIYINNWTNPFDNLTKCYGIKLPTRVMFKIEKDMFWSFDVKLLGFGFSLMRQWNY